MTPAAPSLDLLATAVLLVDEQRLISYLNPAAENLLGVSIHNARGRPLTSALGECTDLVRVLESALKEGVSYTEHDLNLHLLGQSLTLSATISPLEKPAGSALVELCAAGGGARIARDEQVMAQTQASQNLLRQLAHEIRNPLGGIRGAAQLLEAELEESDLKEYTQVIIQETNRLQTLLDRLLAPAKRPVVQTVNLHEVLERVRSLLLAEYPRLEIHRDYDISLPNLEGDPEQLIQAVLNIARNAAQALDGGGRIVLRTRVARQVTLAMKRWKLAVRIDVIDNGPGIPEDMRDQVFFPLISGREGGSGLGLTLAQTLIQRHEGAIHLDSRAGHTCFSIHLPIK
ncbi:MAG: nitrogen regulation protein NR(II) [Pseudomonadota bacterium]|nr:nitrogen regulation protein NR(II) [Pseudomonadota bacterium]MDP1904565.1 nitrogen regulation protein NR(II) [Pseudomonadota bacterium]MDP2353236.1 nitrogen regulation protein NR(II) [Pseudomonadota bacterium]